MTTIRALRAAVASPVAVATESSATAHRTLAAAAATPGTTPVRSAATAPAGALVAVAPQQPGAIGVISPEASARLAGAEGAAGLWYARHRARKAPPVPAHILGVYAAAMAFSRTKPDAFERLSSYCTAFQKVPITPQLSAGPVQQSWPGSAVLTLLLSSSSPSIDRRRCRRSSSSSSIVGRRSSSPSLNGWARFHLRFEVADSCRRQSSNLGRLAEDTWQRPSEPGFGIATDLY